jgi:hypoxanthine phosphoribosyltransferase
MQENLGMKRYNSYGHEILFSEEEIRRRIRELGQEITRDYRNSKNGLVIVGMLKGSLYFVADLTRAIDLDVAYDFMAIGSAVINGKDTGMLKITRGIGLDLKGKDVLVLEEIVRTGLTTNFMLEYLESREPASLKVCALLFNPEQLLIPIPVVYSGFIIDYRRVIGFGLDNKERCRALRDIVLLPDDRQC